MVGEVCTFDSFQLYGSRQSLPLFLWLCCRILGLMAGLGAELFPSEMSQISDRYVRVDVRSECQVPSPGTFVVLSFLGRSIVLYLQQASLVAEARLVVAV